MEDWLILEYVRSLLLGVPETKIIEILLTFRAPMPNKSTCQTLTPSAGKCTHKDTEICSFGIKLWQIAYIILYRISYKDSEALLIL